ncbi:MAG: PLP-dependent transferase [Flavobacteriales bacterium]|nr:PLP-dependent transferase [Flavobacteriales bacterium]
MWSAATDLYGVLSIVHEDVRGLRWPVQFVDMGDLKNVETAMSPNTELIWAGAPAIRCCTHHRHRWPERHREEARLPCFSSTTRFRAGPYLQTPSQPRADIVMHGVTKCLGGILRCGIGRIGGEGCQPRPVPRLHPEQQQRHAPGAVGIVSSGYAA